MTTAAFQLKRQRSRFAHLAWQSVLAALPTVPAFLRAPSSSSSSSTSSNRSLSAVEAASREAQQVRRLAADYARTDPGFAADLYAAAARHEDAAAV